MKQKILLNRLRHVALLCVMLLLGSGNVRGESIVINTTSFTKTGTGSGYVSYNGTRTIGGVDIFSYQVMINSSAIQFQSNKGYLYNSTAIPGKITKITLATATNLTIKVGTSSNPSTGTTVTSGSTISGDYNYFLISGGSSTPKTATITIEYSAKTLSSLAISGTPTKTTYEAGDAFDPAGLIVTGTYSDASTAKITEGIEWTLDPETLSAGATSCDVMATVGTISSDVTTISGLTVTSAKTLSKIEVTGTPATFWKGDTFNHDGMTVTATYDDESTADVTADATFSTPDMTTAGEKTITVTYKGETATYTINVQTIANTQETAYTVAQIKDIVDAGKDLSTEVYVKGTVSQAATYISSGKLNYYISDDGTTTSQQFEFYGNYKASGATQWSAITDVAVGDDVIGYGTATLYTGSTPNVYEFNSGNYLVKHQTTPTFSVANMSEPVNTVKAPTVTTNSTGTVTYSVEDNDYVFIDSDNKVNFAEVGGPVTITANLAATDTYKAATITFTATVTSNATLSSITIGGTLTKSTYTVGEDFSFEGLTATGNFSDETTADLTGTATWTVEPKTLTAATTSVTVKATSGTIEGTKDYAVIVNKKTSSIKIADMTIGRNATDVTISATTTPDNATLTYTITDGSDYITITDGKISAKAPGTATVKATYAGNDDYASTETTFTVTVSNQSMTSIDSFLATSGSLNGDISYAGQKGNASTDPAVYNNCLRLYQNGGYVVLQGVKGVKIQSVTLTTSSTYESTTVGYCVDKGDAPTTGNTVAKSTSYTISGLNNQEVEIYCLGTDKNSRLEIVSLSVTYTKEAVTLSSIALFGSYKTEFIKNEAFTHEGAVVKATFSDDDVQDVTSSAVFSEPDMTTIGDKNVTVSYTHEGVTKTATYTINVAEETVVSIALSGTYKTTFKQNETFSHDGVVVTATYNSARTEDVTSDATFSTPDFSTTGTKTVTVTYAEKEATYEIKVIPAAILFYESFDKNNGLGGNDGDFAKGSATLQFDNDGWTVKFGNGANQCAKFGNGSSKGSAQTPTITMTGAAKITFKAAAWNGASENTTLQLSATSGTLSQESVEMTIGAWKEYTVYLTGVEESTKITFEAANSSNNRFFLDEILVTEAYSRTVNTANLGTLCVPYAFEKPATMILYNIVGKDDSNIYFEEATEVVAGQPYLFRSTEANLVLPYTGTAADEAGSYNGLVGTFDEYTITKGNGDYVLSSNKLYIVGNADFTLADHRAYIHLSDITGGQPAGTKAFTLGFDEETGIVNLDSMQSTGQQIYNMSGQRINKLQNGINIVNGKKVLY